MLLFIASALSESWKPPRPLASGYAVEPVDPVLRTDMEVGSPRTRLRTSADLDHVTLSWIFQAAEMEAFRNWYRVDIARGSAWFDLEIDLGNGGLETHACKFVEIWKSTYAGAGKFNVSAKIEVR